MYYVFLLADYPLLSPHATSYKEAAKKHFAHFKEHKAVSLAKALFEKGFVYGYPVNWRYQYTSFTDNSAMHKVDYPFEKRPISADSLSMFRQELINFYNDASCADFLKIQHSFLDNMLSDVRDSVGNKNIIPEIESYFGIRKQARWSVILSPLLHSGGFTLERKDVPEMYAMIGPGDAKDSLPVFDKTYLEQDLLIHEFSHNYANPITEQFLVDSKVYEKKLFPSVQQMAQEEGYSTWESFMYELITRATTIRIVHKIYGADAANELSAYEKTTGFYFATDIADELKKYELHRDQFPTLADFFPEILKRMDMLKPAE